MKKLLNIVVLLVWVIAQSITAANSGTHMRHDGGSAGHTAQTAHQDHAMTSAAGMHDGHSAAHDAGAPCPVTGQAAPDSNSIAGDCCDHANCHVADLIQGAVAVTGRQLVTFEVAPLHTHLGWSPASPLPPPNLLA